MKNITRIVLAAIFIVASRCTFAAPTGDIARSGSLGIGTALGQPMGVTGKLWLSNMAAIDAMMGYHFSDNFDIHADYLLHSYAFTHVDQGSLPLYFGLGARVLAGDDTQFGIRIPFGGSYLMASQRIEIFAEIAPVIDLTDLGADVDGMVGIRLYTF